MHKKKDGFVEGNRKKNGGPPPSIRLSQIEFSKKTFVLTVCDEDRDGDQEHWPFLEFAADDTLKEAFCTCPVQEALEQKREEEGAVASYCPHIKYALSLLTGEGQSSLSFSFENHFWRHLFFQIAQDDRYVFSYEQKESLEDPLVVKIEAPWGGVRMQLFCDHLQETIKAAIDEKLVYEPSSLRFSTLSSQELNQWRSGRPTSRVRYELSTCSTLSKALYLLEWKAQKMEEPLPRKKVLVDTKYRDVTTSSEKEGAVEQMVYLHISQSGLYALETTLTRDFFLPLLPVLTSLQEGIVGSFTPVECLKSLRIEGEKVHLEYDRLSCEKALYLFNNVEAPLCEGSFWYAVERDPQASDCPIEPGIYYLDSSPDQWPQELDIPDFIQLLNVRTSSENSEEIAPCLPSSGQLDSLRSMCPLVIDSDPKQLKYQLSIDDAGNLQITAYLFSPGDLQNAVYTEGHRSDPHELSSHQVASPIIFDDWVYLPELGIIKIVRPGPIPKLVKKEEMSSFIEANRSFLNQFPGFICWTHGLDFKMDYKVDEEGLVFFSPLLSKKGTMHNYGHWIYIPSKGFFLDHAQLTEFQGVYHDMRIPCEEIEHFLDHNHGSTQNIPHFWSSSSPLDKCYMQASLDPKAPTITLALKEKVKESSQGKKRQNFGRYCFTEGEGFWQYLPSERPPKEILEKTVLDTDSIGPWLQKVKQKRSLERKFLGSLPRFLEPLTFATIEIVDAKYVPEEVQKQLSDFYGRVYLVHLELSLPSDKKLDLQQVGKMDPIDRRYILTEEGMIDLEERPWRWWYTSSKAMQSLELLSPSLHQETLNSPREHSAWAIVDVLTLFKWNLKKQLKIDPTLKVVQHLEKDLQLLMGQEIPLPDLSHLKSILRPYQKLGVKWLWQLYRLGLGGLLCDDMGLGKTHQVMALIAAIWASGGGNRTFFIACPTSVVFHWQSQLSRFLPDVPHLLYHGGTRELPTHFEGILLTTYGVCRLDIAHLERRPFALAIYDEVQLAKNSQSRIYKSLERIQAQIRVGLSGTPVENSLKDLKSLMDLAVAGWMPPNKQFEEEYLIPLERFGDRSIVNKIKSHIHPFVLRREKSEVLDDLPEKVIQTHVCALSDDQKAIYQSVLQQARGSLRERLGGADRGIPYLHIFSALNSLKQICDHPAVYFRNRGQSAQRHEYDCDKWDLFCYLLSEALASGQKVVVFSQYLAMLDIIEEYLHAHNIGYTSVRGNTRQRGERVERFQTDPDCRVFVASLHAAGVGIDLTAGSVVILYDRWWNAAKENQAIDRVHRIGQSKGVQVIRLIVQGTIEEKIDAIIERKAELMKEAVVTDDHRFLKSLSEDEILALLDFNQEESDE